MEELKKEILELWDEVKKEFEEISADFEKGMEKGQVSPLRRFRKGTSKIAGIFKELRAKTIEIEKSK